MRAMRLRPKAPPPWRNERGAANLLVLVFLAVTAVGAYFGYAYFPHWLRNRDVLQAMNEAGYQAWRESDETLLRMILKRTDDLVLVEDEEDGEQYPGIDESMIEISRDAKNVYIEVSYEVPMYLPWTSKVRQLRFDNRVQKDLEVPTR